MQLQEQGGNYWDFSRADDGSKPLRVGVITRQMRMNYFAEATVSRILQEAMPKYIEAPSSEDDLTPHPYISHTSENVQGAVTKCMATGIIRNPGMDSHTRANGL